MLSNPRFLVLCALVLMAALVRFVDHGLINVAPVGAIALFGGACFRSRRSAFGMTFATMLLSDVLLYSTRLRNWADDSWKTAIFVYLGFGCLVLLGRLLKNRRSIGTVAMGSLAGSIAFFLISNVSSWAFYPDYTKDFAGLMQCYWAGIPFLRGQSPLLNSVLSDLAFNGLLFGSYALIEQRVVAVRTESSPA